MSAEYALALSDVCSGYRAFRPPNRVRISQGAAQTLVMKPTGGIPTPWSGDETPYMVEPMDMLASRRHEAVVMVKPARTGGTAGFLLGWMTHAIVNDPGDMLMLHITKEKAREFSKTDVDRALESPKVEEMKSGRVVDSNTFDTKFKHGMWLRIAWPTSGNVAATGYRYVAITDLDRMENADNVDGEGPLFDLARKRTAAFLSRGMTAVESSPGRPLLDPNWKPATKHEAPPCAGILGIYNRSDRRRWYWRCQDCYEHFEAAPGLSLFNLPSDEELLQTIRTADIPALAKEWGRRIVCPCCGSLIDHKWKRDLNRGGIWLPDGVEIDENGVCTGDALQSTIAGYWIGGVAAVFQQWRSLVQRHLEGLRDYALTGEEQVLKTTANVDQGMPYLERHLIEARGNRTAPAERTEEALKRYICPDDTRCVVLAADVQGGLNSRFVVQAHAVAPWIEQSVINRFEIRTSQRDGTGEDKAPIDPARYVEDWDALTELLRTTYRTSDENREIRVKMLVVDTGGEDGATERCYAWYRKIRKLGLHNRVRLYKGTGRKDAPLIKETLVGGRRPGEKGDIPLLIVNTNLMSDSVDAGLKRETPGPGYIHFPSWLSPAFFDELAAETRGMDGVWSQIRKRNESFDLCRMIRVGILALGLDKITDWNRVPDWLKPLPENSETITKEQRRELQANTPIVVPQGEQPAARPARAARPRRVAHFGG